MSIYTDANNEFVINITEWCKNNPLDLSTLDYSKFIPPPNKGKKGLQEAWNKGIANPEQSKIKKEYWEKWKENNPNYKDKWLVNNYVRKGYQSEWRKETMTKTNSIMHECPHCKKMANIGNLKRWHLEKCKYATRHSII